MTYVSKSPVLRRTLVALAAVVAFANPGQALASECAQQWSKMADFLVDFGNVASLPPVITRSMADGGCRTSGIEVPFDRRTHLTIKAIEWSGNELDRVFTQGLPPRSLKIAISGISRKSTFGMPDVDREIDKYLATLSADVTFVAHWDETTRQVSLDLLSISLPQGDYLTARAVADNVDFGSKAKMQMSVGGFSVPSARIIFETVGTFEDVLTDPFGRNLWGRSNIRAERNAIMEGNVDLLPDSFVPPASKEAIKSFFRDTPRPNGTVRIDISANPGLGPVRFLPYFTGTRAKGVKEDFWAMLQGVQIDVTYPAD
jgi:hypothetical protein